MKGNNELHLCNAALQEALEEYLNSTVLRHEARIKVTGVASEHSPVQATDALHVRVKFKKAGEPNEAS